MIEYYPFTISEAAHEYRVPVHVIRRKIAQGQIKAKQIDTPGIGQGSKSWRVAPKPEGWEQTQADLRDTRNKGGRPRGYSPGKHNRGLHISIPITLFEQVEQARGSMPRSNWITAALAAYAQGGQK